MELIKLKEAIKNKSILENFYIFLIKDNDFLALQYSRAIAQIKDKPIEYLSNMNSILDNKKNLFEEKPNSLKIYKVESLDYIGNLFNISEDLIIITSTITEEAKEEYSYCLYEFPKLENWQVLDYALNLGKGISEDKLKRFVELCKYDIFRVDFELSKLSNFSSTQRKYLFEQMIQEGAFKDLSNYGIFDLIDSIQSKDIYKINIILKQLDSINIEPMALTNLLYQGFRKIIQVWLDKYPSPESTGLKSNQIWAIKNIPHNYTKEQLVNIFKFLTSIDRELKLGNLSNINLLDYIIVKVLIY